jgi:hypothetical protein
MKNVLCVCAALLMAFTTLTALAADVTGTWTGDMKGPNGDAFSITFTFKQDGAKLTGTVQGPQGDPMDISNGKVDGDKFSFDVSFNGMTIKHECTLAGDEITMKTKAEDPNFPGGEMTLKRAK